ncbi:MAG: lysophospholipid acyltransferase family protein [Myxococcota bacterium]|nr:lysophospholipid acyltransferase family protein [Myxococcota bacterium]
MGTQHQLLWTTTRWTFCQWLQLRYRCFLAPNADPEPSPPYVVVANHGNFFDPWMIGLYFKHALRIMMSDDGFRAGPISRWYLNGIGAFPKKKGARDLRAMKKTLSFLKRGDPVLIFPEGQATWDGETQPIYRGIERMVKRIKCPLVIARFSGHFLSRPWWAKGWRKGRVLLERTVIPSDQVARMDETEILAAIQTGIHTNDILDARNQAGGFRGQRLAEGVERLIWICVRCGRSGTLATAGNEINCSACGKSWTMDAYCRLCATDGAALPCDNLHAWVQAHKTAIIEAISRATATSTLTCDTRVTLKKETNVGKFAPESTGSLAVSKAEINYTPNDSSAPAYTFPISTIKNCVIQQKDIFEVTVGSTDYRFEMPGRSPMKWLMYIRYLTGYEEIEQRGVI